MQFHRLIRDLFWALLAMGLAIAWALDHHSLKTQSADTLVKANILKTDVESKVRAESEEIRRRQREREIGF